MKKLKSLMTVRERERELQFYSTNLIRNGGVQV